MYKFGSNTAPAPAQGLWNTPSSSTVAGVNPSFSFNGASASGFGASSSTNQKNQPTSQQSFGLSGTKNKGSPFKQNGQTTATANFGTGAPTYAPKIEKEGSGFNAETLKFQSISAMPNYSNWSVEELRIQDYQMGKKGPQMNLFGVKKDLPPQPAFSFLNGSSQSQPTNPAFTFTTFQTGFQKSTSQSAMFPVSTPSSFLGNASQSAAPNSQSTLTFNGFPGTQTQPMLSSAVNFTGTQSQPSFSGTANTLVNSSATLSSLTTKPASASFIFGSTLTPNQLVNNSTQTLSFNTSNPFKGSGHSSTAPLQFATNSTMSTPTTQQNNPTTDFTFASNTAQTGNPFLSIVLKSDQAQTLGNSETVGPNNQPKAPIFTLFPSNRNFESSNTDPPFVLTPCGTYPRPTAQAPVSATLPRPSQFNFNMTNPSKNSINTSESPDRNVYASMDQSPFGNNPIFSTPPKKLTEPELSPTQTYLPPPPQPQIVPSQEKSIINVSSIRFTPPSASRLRLRAYTPSPVPSNRGRSAPAVPSSVLKMLQANDIDFVDSNRGAFKPRVKKLIISDEEGNVDLQPLEYTTSPPLSQLLRMTDRELRAVRDYTVELPGIGFVQFLDTVDLLHVSPTGTRAGIAQIPGTVVILRKRSVEVKTDDEVGFGVNVPALVSLQGCWVMSASGTVVTNEADPLFEKRFRKMQAMKGTTMVGFNKLTGEWRFRVDNF
ncbi:hypothetical protein BCR33DRAFT_846202 [Rhizoclosmatium globosum]|uniref:Peptidase S59 domain-containing protein n=1 Tax=Rhizoclosmatium globosum TaxID=329046 RepID=A0A1Y2CWP0_9FUNG|nr:hypothetical protein BCR33DRAFT_846202 [Rhizoclosmatium globosum]|eukprot:ORY51397.1 hypothetical protein BCR33DRAFT_846202 [Rhizoclosmatium globosum]